MHSLRKYIFLIVFFTSCNGPATKRPDSGPVLFLPPHSYSLDTTTGYIINRLTGDSVLPFKNIQGQSGQTGVTLPIKAEEYFPGMTSGTEVLTTGPIGKKIIANNIKSLPENKHFIQADSFYRSPLSESPLVFAAKEKIEIHIKPGFSKAKPFRFRDEARENVQYLDVDQGLASSYVCSILEDRKGNMWMGTEGAGISRYDGIHFMNYTMKDGLSGNSVKSLMEDRSGNIWIGTTGGLNKFNGTGFVSFPGSPAEHKASSTFEDKDGNVWIATDNGLIKYSGNQFYQYSARDGLPSDTVTACVQENSGQIWVLTLRGLCRFDGHRFLNVLLKDEGGEFFPRAIVVDRHDNIWIGTNRGLIKYDRKRFSLYSKLDGSSLDFIWSVFQDHAGNIWVSNYDGLYRFNEHSFVHYGQKEGVTKIKVREITEDKNGNIWFGTDGGGVNKLNPTGFNYPLSADLIRMDKFRPLMVSKNGQIWFGTELGAFGSFSIPGQQGKPIELNAFDQKKSFLEWGQRALLQDRNGDIWIGTNDRGLIRYSRGVFSPILPFVENSSETIFALFQDKNSNIWFSSDKRGLFRFTGSRFYHYSLPGYTVFSISEDMKGNIWLGTNGGGLIKLSDNGFVQYGEKEGLFAKQITSLMIDQTGSVWIGSQEHGVCVFDGTKFTYYTTKEGLSNNNVWSIAEDYMHHVWVGTDLGLNRFIPRASGQGSAATAYQIWNYGQEDGIKGIDFSLNGVCIDSNKHIWWATGKGVFCKDLSDTLSPQPVRSLILNDIEINNQEYDFRNIPDSLKSGIRFDSILSFTNCPDKLALSHTNNNLRFLFSAIDWSAPHKIRYTFRMIGLSGRWTTPSDEAFADYRNLNPGDYEFQVMAIGQSKIWTEPLSYHFTILPAWWQTWWFKIITYLLAALMILFISRLIYLSRLRKQRVAMEKQMAVQLERQRISAEMHDDIGAGLSGVRLLTEMTKSKLKESGASGDIDKIYQSVGDISAKMKEVIWSLNAENDSLAGLIGYLQAQARQILEHYPGKLVIKVPDLIPDYSMTGEARRHIYLAMKEALNNIIKHSGASLVTLTISCDRLLVIELSDNGRGLTTGLANNGGNGLRNMEKRMKAVNGIFIIKNENGLRLTFKIPLV